MDNNIQESIIKILNEELFCLASRIKQNHIRAGQRASGLTERSIRHEVISASDYTAIGFIWGRPYFGTLETGRCAGKVPADFREIIYDWMQAKGIHGTNGKTQESADQSLAYCIARKIAREGTKLYREGGRNDIYSNEIPSAVERISQRLDDGVWRKITSITLNSLKDGNINN